MTVLHASVPRPARPGSVPVPLAGGGTAWLRPLRHGEEAPLLAVFDRLSPTSRASRYLTGLVRLPRPMVQALTRVDGHDHVAWLATVDGEPAGLARYVRTAPGTPAGTVEVAFEVADAHHGRGLGSALLDAVTTVAAWRGERHVRASVLPANAPSLRLLARLGLRLTLVDGLLEAEGPLRLPEPARVDRAAVRALAAAEPLLLRPVSTDG